MKKETKNGCYRTVRRDKVRKGIFLGLSLFSIVMLYMTLLNGPSNPRMQNTWQYLVMGNVVFMAIMTMCALAKSFYIGKSYDMDHCWIFPTIGFNGKSMYIIWLRFEIFVTY